MKSHVSLVCVAGVLLLAATPVKAQEESWVDRIKFKGDIRLRYEEIDRETREKRDRGRYRARLGLTAKATDNVNVIVQIASGADNPVSRNVTFDGGFTTKDIGFDLAYVDWTPVEGLHVMGGKMKNPLFRAGGAPVIWDSDLNPEGVAVQYDSRMFFATAAGFSVEERSQDSDSHLVAVQLGGKFNLGENLKLTAGAGYFGYSSTIGNEPFYNGAPKGNTVDVDGNYVYDYKNTEVFAQLDTKVGGFPLRVFGQWTQNNEVSEQDSAIAYGVKFGAAKDNGDFEVSWTYQDIDADAVIGTFNDSDFGGGGTDADGHILKAKYSFGKNVFIGGTYFQNSINRFSLPEEDYDRLQLDIEFKFN